jgi:LacI family transcriptional regulator
MSATIYDVASRARVSIATVSRALNAPHTVNGATLQRIQDAIEVLGFVPKAEATARARRNHRQIGVLAPFFTHYPSFMQRMRGIAAALQDTNYELVVYNADTPEHVRGYLHNLPTARRLDGLIVISLLLNDRSVNRLQEYELPTVMVEASHPMLSGIAIDNVAGGRLAAEYLLHKGHRRIGFVGGDRLLGGYAMGTSELRFTGFEAVLRDHNLTAVQADYAPKTSSHEEAYVQALELLRRAERPGAIFAANDTLALGVIRAARECGLRIPEDVALIGFDDADFSGCIGLTTVAQSLEESGRMAVEMLLAMLVEPGRSLRQVQLPLRVAERVTA